MEVKNILINLGIGAYADVFQKNGITIELMEQLQLDPKLIAELIPEIGPRIKFMSYCKTNFSKNEIEANTSDIEANNKNVNKTNEQNLENTMQGTSNSIINEEGGILYRQNAFCSKDMFILDTMPSINDLLQRSQTGRIILQVSKTKELNNSMRNKLCNIIVGYLEDNNITLTNKIAETISERIVKTFSSEAKGTYFIEAKRKIDTKNKKSIAAKGKLWSCWRNRRYAISKLQKRFTHESIIDDMNNSSNDDVSNEDVKKSLEWLKINQTPWEIVLEKWSKTFEYRYAILMKSSDKKLNNIFEEWPLFKHPNGYKLIQYDFDQMQLSDLVLTIEKWNEFFNKITQNTSSAGKNDNFIELMEKLNLDISEDSKLTIAIQLLSYMIPPKQRVKQKSSEKTKQYSKASIVLSRDSMIKCANTCGDITRIRQESSDKAKEMRTSVQPYIIVVGQIENVSQSYVSIDEILYSTKSTLEALDVCFKAFHVLQINYPDASKHLWMLIQKGLYKFRTQWDISFSNTEHILKKLVPNPKHASIQ